MVYPITSHYVDSASIEGVISRDDTCQKVDDHTYGRVWLIFGRNTNDGSPSDYRCQLSMKPPRGLSNCLVK